MAAALSSRLTAAVAALPLTPGLRVLEIGCGPGAAARAVADVVGSDGHVLGLDRSAAAIRQAEAGAAPLIRAGVLAFRQGAIEDFELVPGEAPYDLAFALRVGALDGRHPALFDRALAAVRRALGPDGRLYIDGGDPLKQLSLEGR